ncbi:MAG: J domain-containing protein [Bacillota bacterium]
MEYKDYYKTLGVDKKASAKEIKNAYRKLVKEYHPDKRSGDKAAEAKFKEIAEAYEVLGDEEKRKKYDELGSNWDKFRPGDNWQKAGTSFYGFSPGGGRTTYEFYGDGVHGADFSDFFNAFFGGFDMGGKNFSGFDRRNAAAHGEDYVAEIELSVEEAVKGVEAQVNVHGSNIKVKIPPGVKEGQKIRVAGKGEPGYNGGKPGDLYLMVKMKQHLLYKVEGKDVSITVPISPSEAVLGAKIQIPTPTGPVSISVPPGTSSGKVLRLKNLGLGTGQQKGNLLVALQIVLPPDMSDQEKELYKKLRDLNNFNPRKDLL